MLCQVVVNLVIGRSGQVIGSLRLSSMGMNLERFGVDGVGYDVTETEPPSSTNPQ